jgi:DNA-binding transcriptional LysR family regulator
MWHLRDLGYFVAVADHRNFTRAAQALFVSQPSLSKQVAALEQTLGTPLFRREHDGVRLTRAGEALLPLARRILATAAEAEAAVSAASAELTIGFWLSPGLGLLPDALARFARLHPDAGVALRRAEWSDALAGVEARRADIGLLWWPEGCSAPALGQVVLGQVVLAREETVIAMPATHPLAQRDEVLPADIRDETVLDAPPEWRRSLNVPPIGKLGRRVHVVRTIDESVENVVSGLGLAIVPFSVVGAHMPPTIVARPLRGLPRTELVAVWRQEDKGVGGVGGVGGVPHMRSLIRCVVQAAQAVLPGLPGLPDRQPADLAGGRPADLDVAWPARAAAT